MDVLHIALIVLAIAGIWAIVELALTFRKARESVDTMTKEVAEVTDAANQAIVEVQPIIAKVDGIVTDLEPTVQGLEPLLNKASTAMDVVTVDLASVNDILVDVSAVTDSASNVTSTVSKAANSAVSGVAGVVGKFTGTSRRSKKRLEAEKAPEAQAIEGKVDAAAPQDEAEASVPAAKADKAAEDKPDAPSRGGYYTYGETDSE